jgi:hypothetical protein
MTKTTRAQAEQAASAMQGAADGRDNLVTLLRVPQYPTWRARFEGTKGQASARLFRGGGDTVAILADTPGYRDALAWAAGAWQNALPAQGVTGTPAVYFGTDPDRQDADEAAAFTAAAASLKLMSHFTVYDYDQWHQLFLQMATSRAGGGLTNLSIFRGSQDANDLVVLGDVADEARLRAWLVEDQLTGYPAATGAARGTYRLAIELPA